jgi:glyceraldehyde-3-phosphate dehydrogenase/erythrose-4-phosphate dehydrogenase
MAVLKLASETTMKGVLGYTEDLVVSQDFVWFRTSIIDANAELDWILLSLKLYLGTIMSTDILVN